MAITKWESREIMAETTQNAEAERPSLSARLADHICSTRSTALPADARDAAKLFMLDTLAVAWAGSGAPGCPEIHGVMKSEGGREDATTWAFGSRLPAAAAGFVNATTAAALDYDTLGRDVPVHVSIAVVPAALAVAERVDASGEDLLAAMVIASDVEYRLAVSSLMPHRGWSYTGIHGVFGAAAAAARLLKLDMARTQHALGLAYLQASGNQQANIEPSLAKRLLSSFAVRSGIHAALLAEAGITAPPHVFEGDFGFFTLYQPADEKRILDRLGQRFDGVDQSLKKYPSCGCNHTAIEGVLQLVEQHDILPQDVNSVNVRISPYIYRIVGMPYDPSVEAQAAAQFSITYSIACALTRRRLGLAEIEAEAAHDPAIRALERKVSILVEPEWSGDRGPIELLIEARGRRFETRVDHVPGSREAPLSAAAIRMKHRECFGLGVRPLSPDQIDKLESQISSLETLASARKLLAGLS